MNQQRLRLTLLAVCFLVCTGLALDCDWDHFTEEDLDLTSLTAGARFLDQFSSDRESCRDACCNSSNCDLALVVNPADGKSQCQLVSCMSRGRDACVLQPGKQFQVYRKKVKTEMKKGVKGLQVVPLLISVEPRTYNTEDNNIRCRLPMKVGFCRAAFNRSYYNVTNQSCQTFIYGGCGANRNNFESQEECEATCSGVSGSLLPDESPPVKAARMAPSFTTDESKDTDGLFESEPDATQRTEMSADDFSERCEAEPQVGPCRAMFRRWYYNKETRSCQLFIYGGCRGNKNNYDNKESCMTACTVSVLPSLKRTAADVKDSAEYKDQCMVTPDPGPCRAAFPMFYYDPDTSTCQSFMYGGCRGNQNRYGTEKECMSRCGEIGLIGPRGRTRDRWTAAVFLFVTLASISALLLATLVFITLRRHRLSRHPSSISDKEELLPDPDEQSSVESLTVPESPQPDKA